MNAIPLSPFELNLKSILQRACRDGASDLHIEPIGSCIRIRIRVDGILRTIQEIHQIKLFERFLMQCKRLSGFNMSKLDIPQDARFCIPELGFDFRASLIPTMHGEKIVLRLLERNKAFSLASCSIPNPAKEYLHFCLQKWQGLILVSGPTGSGKTTLLYSLLSELDRTSCNIHTLEDPIEYTMDGVIQTQMRPPEVTFEKALRALLRQDPDAILVGEIRDEETAQAALHAASTGHLIFSSIHANSAKECLERLISLGEERKLVEENLLFASAQRLVPKICPQCSGQGECSFCDGLGHKGRVLLFEYIDKHQKQLGSLQDAATELFKEGVIDAASVLAFTDHKPAH